MSDNDAPPTATNAPDDDVEIDWIKEPATERERRIRAVLLRNALAQRSSFSRLELHTLLSESATRCVFPEDAASDFRAAYAVAQTMADEIAAKRKKQRIEAAIREVDDPHEEQR